MQFFPALLQLIGEYLPQVRTSHQSLGTWSRQIYVRSSTLTCGLWCTGNCLQSVAN